MRQLSLFSAQIFSNRGIIEEIAVLISFFSITKRDRNSYAPIATVSHSTGWKPLAGCLFEPRGAQKQLTITLY